MGNNTTIMTGPLEVSAGKEIIVTNAAAPSFQEQLKAAWKLHRAGEIALVSLTIFSEITYLNII
jgi:hypothetical protein